MNYWTYVPFTGEELEALAEGHISFELHERFERHLANVREHEAGLEHARQVGERLDWNAEMERLMGEEP